MLFKLVLTFIAAAHCLPGYKKHAKSAERLHALEKELDALKHVAEPQMERGFISRPLTMLPGGLRTCQEECEDAFGKPASFFFKWVEAKYGPEWRVEIEDKFLNGDKQLKRTYAAIKPTFFCLSAAAGTCPFCKSFCKKV